MPEQMTQSRWNTMTPAEKDASLDDSQLHSSLRSLKGWRVEGLYYGERKRFIVGQTTGWRPATIGMHNIHSQSSSAILTAGNFTLTRAIEKVR